MYKCEVILHPKKESSIKFCVNKIVIFRMNATLFRHKQTCSCCLNNYSDRCAKITDRDMFIPP